jgi:hypothetical protein
MARRHIDWDPDELRALRVGQRMSYPAIGRILGCHHTTVMLRCWRFGIEPKPSHVRPRCLVSAIRSPRQANADAVGLTETEEQAALWQRLLTQNSRMKNGQA